MADEKMATYIVARKNGIVPVGLGKDRREYRFGERLQLTEERARKIGRDMVLPEADFAALAKERVGAFAE